MCLHRVREAVPAHSQPRGTAVAAVAAALLAGCLGNAGDSADATSAKTSEPAAASTRQRALAAALNPNGWVAVPQPTDALLQNLNIPGDAPSRGMWSAPAAWPMVGVNQAVLPNGKVLTWGTTPDGGGQNGRYFDVWDPDRGLTDPANHQLSFDAARQDSFCAPALFVGDGRLMITGGNGTNNNGTTSQFYTAPTSTFAQGPSVADERWYAAMVTLPDGRSMMLGGIKPYTEGQYNDVAGALARGESSMTPEVFENGAWRTLFGAQSRTAFGPDFLRASLPKVWTAPDGRVFGIGTDQMYYVDANAGGGNGAISIAGAYKTPPQAPALNDTAPNVGPTMTAVMYAPGKVMTVGGNAYHNGAGFWGSRKATSIDLNGGGAVLTELPAMAFARHFANAIALPDGKVLVTGGEIRANNDPALGVFAAEQWNPATNAWSTLASSTVFRGYHSQSALLPNGTVLVTGGGNPGPVQLRGDVFYPPYLFRTVNGAAQLAPRPRLVGISGLKVAHGAPMQFDMADASTVSQVAMIGLSVGTHSFNSGQRRIPLTFTQDNFRVTATVPNANLVPPGYYQLVAVNAAGVPSRGTIVAVGNAVAAPPVATSAYVPPDTGTVVTPPPAPGPTPPASATACGAEGQTCTVPAGSTATVWFGADTRWVSRAGVTGSIACSVATFGDPAVGVVKSCRTEVTATTPPPPGPGTVPAGVRGAWTFDTLSGATAPDSSGNNRPITLANTSTIAGRVGAALQFNGANASGSTAAAVLDTAGSFSVSTWVRLDALTGWRTMVNQDGAAVSGFWLQYSEFVGSKFLLSMHDVDSTSSAPVRAIGTTTPVVGQWYHVVGVRDKAAGLMKIFVNGRLEGTTPYAGGWAANGTFNIGRGKYGGPNDWVAGAMDQVKAFGNALSDADVAALYAADSGPTTPPPAPGPITIPAFNAPLIAAGGTASYNVAATAGLTYSWNFGDGSPSTAFSATGSITKVFANPGVYGVTLTARAADGSTATRSVLQAVRGTATAGRPSASSALALETRANASARVLVANPDNDSVSVIDTATNTRVAEIAVGKGPRSVAIAGDGRVWVSNKDAASISIVSPATLAVVQTVNLPAASQPHGLAFAQGGSAYVVLEATGRLLKLDPVSGAQQGSLALGAGLRHVSLSGDGALALVPRFITPALPGESTAVVDTAVAGAEVMAVSTASMSLSRTIVQRHSDKVDNEIQGAGIPNYLGAAAISPDGASAWVPSKQDNIKRGTLRNGQGLNFQNAVRAISSRIDMANLAEDLARRVDHDNSSLASAAAYHPSGAYLFVALETSRQVAVLDPVGGRELLKLDVGRAPQGVAVSADGLRLYVQNFMGRSVTVLDLAPLVNQGSLSLPVLATVNTVAADKLPAQVLLGKQLFYDARDPRLARDSYMSCASCHSDAGHDGRTWDFTGFGEGLRNTPSLKGRAVGQGFVHWSANFDEIQDFEGQIRAFAGGTGLMPDAQFNTGTRNTPLGDRKAGVSADLDALAAYLGSLSSFDPSPLRNADGTLTPAALAGKTVFTNANCASCHAGAGFTGSADATGLKNIGTIKATSGQRLAGALTGLDTPTLRDVWRTGPYLHDGSAATLAAAVQAHRGNTVSGVDLDNLVAYLQQIGSQEAGPPGAAAPVFGNGTGLSGRYFANNNLSGTPVLTRTEVPWFNWQTGAPAAGLPADNFSVRWVGEVQAVEAGGYQFRTNSDDGVRVWVNGNLIINNWTVHAPTIDTSGVVTLTAGQRVPIVVEYQEFGGGAVLELSWLRPGANWAAMPATQLYPAAAPATGVSPPSNAVACSNENATCVLPAGATATVWYGAGTGWVSRTGVTGSIACNNATFGDPIPGTFKSCRYVLTATSPTPPVASPQFGSLSLGTAFTDPVAPGQNMTGVVVRAGWWIDSIQGLATPANLPAHGGLGGGVFTASWPAGEVLVRVFGRVGSSGVLAQVSFATNTGRVLGPYGTAQGVGTLTPFDYTVPAGRKVVGFTGRSGSSVNAIGVIHAQQ
jgi:large repetitive protein